MIKFVLALLTSVLAIPAFAETCDHTVLMGKADAKVNAFAKSRGATQYIAGRFQSVAFGENEFSTIVPFSFVADDGGSIEGYFAVSDQDCSVDDYPIFTGAEAKKVH